MLFSEIKQGTTLKHSITGEIIVFASVDLKNDKCMYLYKFNSTNKSGYKTTKLSGFKIPLLLKHWEIEKP